MGVLVESGAAYCALWVRLLLQRPLLAWSSGRLLRLSPKLSQAFVFALQLYKRSPDLSYSASANGERLDWLAINFLLTFFTPFIVSVVFCSSILLTHECVVSQAMYPMVIILLVTLSQSRCDMLYADQSRPPASIPFAFSLRTISDGGTARSTVQVAVVSGERRRESLDSRIFALRTSVSSPPRAASRRESVYSSCG